MCSVPSPITGSWLLVAIVGFSLPHGSALRKAGGGPSARLPSCTPAPRYTILLRGASSGGGDAAPRQGRGLVAEQVNDLLGTPELPDRGGSFLFQPVGARPFVTPERFSPEQRQFFRTGAEFTRAQVVAKRHQLVEHDYPMLRDLIAQAGELGLLGVDIGEDFGGLGLDKVTSMLVAESQAGDGSWATTFGAHTGIGTLPIVFFGTPEQKAKYLPDLASGRKVAAYALSEAGSGSDALGAKTAARLSPDGTHYVLNGGKM